MSDVVQLEDAAEKREERRRISTMNHMAASAHASIIELNRAKTLGDSERACAFRELAAKFELLAMKARSLQEESEELMVTEMTRAGG